nr:DUF3662 and FHA domain-containing protein [Motilibacter deserti]
MQRFERRIETFINGAFARAFKSEVEPVEIAAALQRETDDKAQIVSRTHTMTPNEFVVELSKRDNERLSPYSEPLAAELADMVREHAEAQRYTPVGPIRVAFELHDDLDTGMFRVRSTVRPASGTAAAGSARPAPAPRPQPAPPAYAPPAPPAAYAPPAAPRATPAQPAQPPRPAAPAAYLEVGTARFPLDRPVTVLGRGTEVDVRIDDPGVSRRHAQVQVAGGRARLVDLGSTNGTLMHGQRVRDVDLHDGDELVLGRTTVVFRLAGAPAQGRADDGWADGGRDDGGRDDVIPGLR